MQFKEILEGVDLWLAILWVLLVAAILLGVVKAFPVVRKFVTFVNDVAGEEARPGFPARPGLFDRIHSIEITQQSVSDKVDSIEIAQKDMAGKVDTIEIAQKDMAGKVEKVHHELFPNSGKSLRDQTNRIEAKVTADYKEIGKIRDAVGDLDSRLDEHIEVATGILKTLQIKEEK